MTVDLYKKIFHLLLLAFTIATCYSGTLNNSWHFDDFPNIVKNKNIQIENFSWEQIKKSFYSPMSGNINRPLAGFSFSVNYIISGLNTISYHIVNILIHIFCAFFVYLVFIITLKIYCEKNKCSIPELLIQDIALLGAIFWAIHPIQTQAVTYIVQRMASMAAMFYMGSFYFYLKFRLEREKGRKLLHSVLGILFWIAGMLCKENAALLPLSILAYEIILFRSSLINNLKFRLLFYGSFVSLMLVTLFFMSGEIFQYFEKAFTYRPFTMWERFITEPIILTRYIFLLIIPVADFLTLESNIFASSGLLSPPITLAANVFILILIILSLSLSRRFPLICYALIFYFINHLIESTIFDLELYFEHRNYLPSIFIYLSISYFWFVSFSYFKEKNKKFIYSLFVVLAVSTVISEGNATYLRNEVWRDEISLNLNNIEKAPLSVRGYNNLAAEYIKIGQKDQALEYLRQSEQIYKNRPEVYQQTGIADIYYNAGLIYLHGKENIEKSVQLLLKSVDLNPLGFMMHYQLAVAFFKLEDIENAETAILNATQLSVDQSQVYNLLGRILYEKNDYDLAIKAFNRGIELEKRRELYFNLAASYLAKGNYTRARSVLISIDVNDNDLLYLLFRFVSSSELEKEFLAKRIVTLIQDMRIDYCKWIQEVHENNHVGIIYPDISDTKEMLNQAYIIEQKNRIEVINSEINEANIRCI